MSLSDLATAIDASRRSQGRRRAESAHARARALTASIGAVKRTEMLLLYVSPATKAEIVKHATAIDAHIAGYGAYLVELAIRKLLPGLPRRSRPNPLVPCACGCGRQFEQMDDHSRARRFLKGHNLKGRAANRPSAPVACGCGCGERLERLDEISRPRRFVKGHNSKRAST